MIYDVAIIGGGSAGMIAACRTGELGAHVVLLEKNNNLGVKLLATGNGRCNITNMMADNKENIKVYGKNFKFLFSVFNKFSVLDTIKFFKKIGVKTKIEDNNRVFPLSNKASDVQSALIKYFKKNNVEIMLNAEVKEIVATTDNKIEKIILKNNKEIFGKNFIICVGGKSYAKTGSTGDGYVWLAKLGHNIIKPRQALVPIIVEEKIVKKLEGLSLKNVEISIFQNNKKIISKIGEIIFTADGLSGPAIIDLSSCVGSLLPAQVFLQIDFFPEIEFIELEKKLQNDFHQSRNKMFKNYLTSLVSPKLALIIIKLSSIDEFKQVSDITKEERQALVCSLKKFILKVKELKNFDKAMLTAGGVDVKEVDPKTMRSKLYQNLFLAGEILDLDGPTGGYNLQICWSTGFVAGESVIV